MSDKETTEKKAVKIFLRYKKKLIPIGTTEQLENCIPIKVQIVIDETGKTGEGFVDIFKLNNEMVKNKYFAIVNRTKTANLVVAPLKEALTPEELKASKFEEEVEDFNYEDFTKNNIEIFPIKILKYMEEDAVSIEDYEEAAKIRDIISKKV